MTTLVAARGDGPTLLEPLLPAFQRELDDTMTLPLLVRPAAPEDAAAIEALHDRVSGPGRFAKASYRVREGADAASPWCHVVFAEGRLVAAIRFTPVSIGGALGQGAVPPLMVGPLAVDPDLKGQGLGKGLVALGLEEAADDGVPLVILVGDPSYYNRFGFIPVPPGQITMPGPVNPARLLARELVPGSLATVSGAVTAC
jgi:predicted N-acetyltransferase YhbS